MSYTQHDKHFCDVPNPAALEAALRHALTLNFAREPGAPERLQASYNHRYRQLTFTRDQVAVLEQAQDLIRQGIQLNARKSDDLLPIERYMLNHGDTLHRYFVDADQVEAFLRDVYELDFPKRPSLFLTHLRGTTRRWLRSSKFGGGPLEPEMHEELLWWRDNLFGGSSGRMHRELGLSSVVEPTFRRVVDSAAGCDVMANLRAEIARKLVARGPVFVEALEHMAGKLSDEDRDRLRAIADGTAKTTRWELFKS
jgi:hypothetical protein